MTDAANPSSEWRAAKGVGRFPAGWRDGDPAPPWRVLGGDVPLPAAVLRDARVAHNLAWMQRFVDAYGMKLAPHGKTTMTPRLFARQRDAGAWGVTVATAVQAQVAARFGAERVLIANQVVDAANIAILADLVASRACELFCLVDSPEGVDALGAVFAARGSAIDVLLELGPLPGEGGFRTGLRSAGQERAVLDAIARHAPHVRLAGIEVYEGVVGEEAAIRTLLRRAVATTAAIDAAGGFARVPAILSGAGSAWYDVVAEEFAPATQSGRFELVLRPGCYLSHDGGLYAAAQADILARNPVAASMQGGLLPALELWAAVQSLPDDGRAVIAMGKRDVAFDAGLPRPMLHFRPDRDEAPAAAPEGWTITGMMDQHAFMNFTAGDDVKVGDIIGFGISHPCLTFDKWRHLLLVDEDYRCLEILDTYF